MRSYSEPTGDWGRGVDFAFEDGTLVPGWAGAWLAGVNGYGGPVGNTDTGKSL